VIITAIFRDTTLQAFEGCLFGPATGWWGLLTNRTTHKPLRRAAAVVILSP
jgi:hypothetical protein